MTAFPTGSTEAMNRDAKRARRLIAASRLALWWERAWEASWRGLTTLGATAALALFDVWTSFPGWLRLACVFALIAAALVFFWRDWRAVRWPTRDEAVRRLERRNGVAHRPLASMDDALASGGDDPLAAELWRRHVARQTAALAGLEPAWPKPDLPSRDVYALRGLAFLGVIGGLAVAGGDAPARLAAALSPDDERAVSAPALAVDAWIAPPDYPGLAPIILTQARGALPLEQTGAVSAPAGSKLSIRLNAPGEPVIERTPLEDAPPETADAPPAAPGEIELTRSERVRVSAHGEELGEWEIVVLPDAPPHIAFDGEIEPTQRLATRIPFKVGDDYGVTKAEALIRLAPEAMDGFDPTAEEGADEMAIALPSAPRGEDKAGKTAAYEDLTAHPWAGLEVIVQLSATDALEQTGYSEEKRFTLPERVFVNPLARAVIEQRRELSRGPGAVARVATALEAFTIAPEAFGMKPAVYLGLRSAYWRLMQMRVRKDIAEVQSMLWDIALSIEDGGVTLAAEQVRQLQKDLKAALENGASDEEIARLTEQLRQAMRALASAMADAAPTETIPLVEGETVEMQDIEDILNRIEELNRLGAKEAAQELLSQLQDMMEGMGGPIAEPSERERELARDLAELNELVREQERLRDRTYREGQRLEDGDRPEERDLAGEQGALNERMDKLIGEAKGEDGETPQQLAEAAGAMEGAEGALKESRHGHAVEKQDEALEKLKAARDAARQQLAEEQKKNGGMRVGRGGRRPGADPAGRPEGDGPVDSGSVKVPTERETQRAREIQDELRRRSGEQDRTPEELDYLERLLERF